jgi:tetratricopeptide (TPR) repeat protein
MKKILLFLLMTFFSTGLFAQKIESIYKQAVKYHRENKYMDAIRLYTKVIEKDSTIWRAFFNRGHCYASLDQYDKMLSDYQQALRIHPNDTIILKQIANAYAVNDDHLSSIKYYKKSLMLGVYPNYEIFEGIGSSYYFSGQNDSARKYLLLSYNLNPTYVATINNLAWANLDHNPNESCRLFNEAYIMDSLDVRNINNLGYSHLLCGSLDKAFELIKKAETLDPNNSFVYRNYGLYYLRKNNKVLACQNLRKALDLKIIEQWGQSYVAELITYCNRN